MLKASDINIDEILQDATYTSEGQAANNNIWYFRMAHFFDVPSEESRTISDPKMYKKDFHPSMIPQRFLTDDNFAKFMHVNRIQYDSVPSQRKAIISAFTNILLQWSSNPNIFYLG
jgi:hypothetical protein